MKRYILVLVAAIMPAQVVTVDNTTFPQVRAQINANFSWLNANKAALSHVHLVADVTGLQAALDGKSATTHNHNSAYAALSHVHLIADISDFPTLGTAAAANIGSAMGDVAPGDHTHAGVYEPADAGIQAHIGSTSNPHGVTKTQVGLGSVDNTADAAKNVATAVTLAAGADRTKLDGIAAGAEVNVNADWNAASGDAQILNKPTLGDAAAKNTGTTAGTVAAGNHAHSGVYEPVLGNPDADGKVLSSTSAGVRSWVALGAGHTQNTDTGTTATSFQIDSGNTGPRIKNNAGTMEVRNAADGALAPLRAASLELGDGTTPWNMTGLTDDVAPTAPSSANEFTVYVDRTTGLWSYILNGGTAKYAALGKWTTFTGPTAARTYTLPDADKTLLATDGSAANLTNFPTFNQNTTGTAGGLSGTALGGDATNSGNTITLAAKHKTWSHDVTLDAPVTGDSGRVQFRLPYAGTVTSISCSVAAATSATINWDERAVATPNTAGTAVLTSDLVCDTDSAVSTTFSNATLAADVPVALTISAVSGTPGTLRVHIKGTID